MQASLSHLWYIRTEELQRNRAMKMEVVWPEKGSEEQIHFKSGLEGQGCQRNKRGAGDTGNGT